MSSLKVNGSISIPLREISFGFSRSGGAGGQNVNKVNTKVSLRWIPAASRSLPEPVLDRLLEKAGRRINADGVLQITSQRYRDQGRNVADCLEKLRALVASVAVAPKKRKKTKPTKAASERRLADKRRRARKKEDRRPISNTD